MAGDWIPMRIGLADDPDVVDIAARVGLEEDTVVGRLLRFWGWADQHTADGNANGVTPSWLDRKFGTPGLTAALEAVGWLEVTERGVILPEFDRYLGKGGKKRVQTNQRVANLRQKRSERYQNGDGGNAAGVTKSVTTEQKRTEQKKEEPNGSSTSAVPPTKRLEFSEWDSAFARRMFADIGKVTPSPKPPQFDAWANDLRLLREVDKRAEADIEALWSFANADSFWRTNVLSPRKLREKWDQLSAKRLAASRAGPAPAARAGRDLTAGHRELMQRLQAANGHRTVQQPNDPPRIGNGEGLHG